MTAVFGRLSLWFELTARFYLQLFTGRFRFRETVDQLYQIAVESFAVIVICITFVSFLMSLELSFHMRLVIKQDSLVPAFSNLLMLRELAPILTSLLLGSRVGSAIAAEIASMKNSEQLDALKIMSLNPVDILGVPRFVSSIFATMTLSLIAVVVSILIGITLVANHFGYAWEQYLQILFLYTKKRDLFICLSKAFVYGNIMAVSALWKGFSAERGSQGVGKASASSVVEISVLIIIADFVLTWIFA